MFNKICYIFTFKSPCSLKQVLNGESLEMWEAVTFCFRQRRPTEHYASFSS